MKFSLGYSPCPNDCFIFDALVHNKIDTEGFEFDVQLEDVESLNKMAKNDTLDITKLSFHAYAYVNANYILLKSGSALGFNCGPLLIKKQNHQLILNENSRIAIPGKLTTANFLLSLAYPNLQNKVEYLFSAIENAIIKNEVDAGLIIHENRFTYQDKGLEKIIDLGEYWDTLIHAPIPLGGIVMKRAFDAKIIQKVNQLIRKSVEFAFANPESSMMYVKAHAQEMNEDVMKKHIALYVNNFSIDLGDIGKNAIELMFHKAEETGLYNAGLQKLIID
ncbi:MAG: 1,4-dihydroxy-6-naphthoate synthase [Bacteroidota bacterium]